MPLQWQNIEIPIAGVDQYTAAEHVILTKMHTMENVRFYKPPAVSKRNGYEELGTQTIGGGSMDTPLRLHGFKQEMLALSQQRVYAYGETPALWSERGNTSDFLFTQQKLTNDVSRSISEADSALVGSCMVVAWGGAADTVQGCIIDLATNTIVGTISFTGAAGAMTQGQHRVIALGTYIFIVWHATGTGALSYASLNTAGSWAFGAATNLAITSGVGTSPIWDAAALSNSSTQLLVGYMRSSDNAPQADIFTHTNGVFGAAPDSTWANDAAINVASAVAIMGTDNEDVYFVYNTDVPSTRVVVLSDTLGETVAPAAFEAATALTHLGLCRLTASSAIITYEFPVVTVTRAHTKYRTINDAGTVSAASTFLDWVPASKPFILSGSIRLVVAYESSEQPTYALAEVTDDSGTLRQARWHGTYARARAAPPGGQDISPAGSPTKNVCFLPAVNADSTRGNLEVSLGVNYQARFAKVLDETYTIARAGINRLSMAYTSSHAQQCADWGQEGVFIAGSRPSYYDGNSVAEHGFSTYPERFVFNAVAGSGQLTAGDYDWVLVYEYIDNAGNIIRSVPSQVKTNTAGANQLFNIDFDEELWTARATISGYSSTFTSVRVIPYRTLVGPPANAVFYRDSVLGFSATNTTTVQVGATFDDTNLVLQEQLYTTGDILDNAGTPPCKDAHFHNGRMYLVGAEEEPWVWFSQPYQEGEQPRFNEALRIPVDAAVYALDSLDENLVAFHANGISIIVGDGPAATGGLDLGYSIVTVPSDVGCIVPESIVRTPVGLMFQSAKGIHLLKRDATVEWIGAPVKRILETYTQVVGAMITTDAQEVIFTVRSLAASGRLVYNLALDQWTFDTCPLVATSGTRAYREGRYAHVYCTTTMRYFAQGTVTTTDSETATAYPAVKIRTPYIKLNTLQGWQAVRKFLVLATRLGDHGVTISVDYDYEGTFAETHTWTIAEITALTKEQLEIHCTRHKCEAIAFQFLETNVTFDGTYFASAGPEVISLVCEGGFKRGVQKRRDAATHRK